MSTRKREPRPFYDPRQKIIVIPDELVHSVESLVDELDRRRTPNDTEYKIAKASGLTINAVKRFFRGYRGSSAMERARVNEPDRRGRVRLDVFLKIVQTMGYDLEIVAREAPGRKPL